MNEKPMQKAQTLSGEYYRLSPFDGSQAVYFSIPKVEQLLRTEPEIFSMVQTALTKEVHDLLIKECGIEESFVAKITSERAERPGFAVLWGKEKQHFQIIDGNHRAVWRYRHGLPTFSAYAIPLELAKERCLLQLPAGYD